MPPSEVILIVTTYVFWLSVPFFQLSGHAAFRDVSGRPSAASSSTRVWLTTEVCCPEDLLSPKNKGYKIQYGKVIIESKLSGWRWRSHLNGEKKKKTKFSGNCLGTPRSFEDPFDSFPSHQNLTMCHLLLLCFFFAQCLYDQADKSSLLLVKVSEDAALLQIQFRISVEESFLEKTVINVSFTASKIVFWVLFWRFFFPILLQCSHSVVLSSRFRAPFSVPFCCLFWADLICSIQHWDIQFFVLQAIFSLTQDFLTVKVLFELSKWIFFPRWQGSFAVQWRTLICWLFFFLGLY